MGLKCGKSCPSSRRRPTSFTAHVGDALQPQPCALSSSVVELDGDASDLGARVSKNVPNRDETV